MVYPLFGKKHFLLKAFSKIFNFWDFLNFQKWFSGKALKALRRKGLWNFLYHDFSFPIIKFYSIYVSGFNLRSYRYTSEHVILDIQQKKASKDFLSILRMESEGVSKVFQIVFRFDRLRIVLPDRPSSRLRRFSNQTSRPYDRISSQRLSLHPYQSKKRTEIRSEDDSGFGEFRLRLLSSRVPRFFGGTDGCGRSACHQPRRILPFARWGSKRQLMIW